MEAERVEREEKEREIGEGVVAEKYGKIGERGREILEGKIG